MNIALINPPQFSGYSQPPIGLATLASILRQHKHTLTIFDYNAEQLPRITDSVIGFDVVGFTAMTPTIGAVMDMARQIKKAHPKKIIIVGGVHPTLLPTETLEACPEIDFVIIGEGEQTIVSLLQALEPKGDFSSIPGIAYRVEGKLFENVRSGQQIDLNSLPFPAYELLPIASYHPHPPHGRKLPYAILMTSRGCPYDCIFCSKPVFGSRFRAENADKVVDDIERLIKDYGIKEIGFFDDVFTLSMPRVASICDGIIKRRLKVNWFCGTRVNLVNADLLRDMKVAGCYSIAYGIESGNPEILAKTCKGVSTNQITEAVSLTQKAGIETIGYFMIGLPNETKQTAQDTIDFAKRLKLDYAQFAITKPFMGSELYRIHREGGGAEIPWGTSHGTYEFPIFHSNTLPEMDIDTLTQRAYRQFYIRPSYFWQRISHLKSFGDIRTSWDGMIKLAVGLRRGEGIK
jgi:radical SAM superfamily enzyme YgiQ (UPF0313 family)